MACFGALPHIGPFTCRERASSERAGFPLLPSFGRPHYTIRLDGDDPAGLTRLLDALGPAEANKYHRRERPGRR